MLKYRVSNNADAKPLGDQLRAVDYETFKTIGTTRIPQMLVSMEDWGQEPVLFQSAFN